MSGRTSAIPDVIDQVVDMLQARDEFAGVEIIDGFRREEDLPLVYILVGGRVNDWQHQSAGLGPEIPIKEDFDLKFFLQVATPGTDHKTVRRRVFEIFGDLFRFSIDLAKGELAESIPAVETATFLPDPDGFTAIPTKEGVAAFITATLSLTTRI